MNERAPWIPESWDENEFDNNCWFGLVLAAGLISIGIIIGVCVTATLS